VDKRRTRAGCLDAAYFSQKGGESVDQEPRERGDESLPRGVRVPPSASKRFIKDLVAPASQLSREQALWVTRIGLVLAVLLTLLTLMGLPFGITLWAWLKLLIVPVVLAIGGYLFTRSENRAARLAAEQRAQDEALQAYLDQIGQLLLDKDRALRQSSKGDEVRTLARSRTLTVLARLDGYRKGSVVRFLFESGLIIKPDPILELEGADLRNVFLAGSDVPAVVLRGTNLERANLRGAKLNQADLSLTILYRAMLNSADLIEADLREAFMDGANLSGAELPEAKLIDADLSAADLIEANLIYADLRRCNLRSAKLSYADLNGANLSGADLSGVLDVTYEELEEAKSLKGATMPNGQKYEDWLKDRERRKEDAEND
jgi:uncharacterized protein YjbI with pentapeptide repeats